MECSLIDWNAVGAVATAAATLVALWLGMSEAVRRRTERTFRGNVVLAMQVPEISRLVALFNQVESHYRGILDSDGKIQYHVTKLDQLAPAFETSLTRFTPNDFCDMPKRLGFNLPTVIHALPAVACYARRMKVRHLAIAAAPVRAGADKFTAEFAAQQAKDREIFMAQAAEAFDYTHSCSIDFRAAMAHAEKHLMPDQMKNLASRLPERFETEPQR